MRIPKTSAPATAASVFYAQVSSSLSGGVFSKERPENGSLNPSPEFDFNAPCQYFKSSFARSLSMNTGSQTKSLDFGINFGLPRSSPIKEEPSPAGGGFGDENSADLGGAPPPPPPRTHPPTVPANGSNCRSVWSTAAKQSFHRRSLDSTEIEVLRLRKECQSLVEENRRLMGLASGVVGGNLVVPGNSPNIEAVILQTQVDTLQWQLKQVEASRQMYRAVMEEVVRFLERCHRNLDSMQKEQIARSKSIHHVYRAEISNENNPASPRARSSTNLSDVQKSCPNKGAEEATSSPLNSYNNFRDFTWRRNPKRASSSQLVNGECDPEKLSQEAFRLLRTAQNLLNTQEPDLTAPKHTMDPQYSTNFISPSVTNQGAVHFSSLAQNQKGQTQLDSDPFCLSFTRKMNMRESRLSLRSSTDGSVHSTSSSKTETDEENHSPPLKDPATSSATEDESGFSSISSFQEIGLPLSSTMISSSVPTAASSASDDSAESNTDLCLESRNSTLKASQQSVVSEVGLPSTNNNRRCDSAPAVPPRTSLQRFSTLPTNDYPAVLWV